MVEDAHQLPMDASSSETSEAFTRDRVRGDLVNGTTTHDITVFPTPEKKEVVNPIFVRI